MAIESICQIQTFEPVAEMAEERNCLAWIEIPSQRCEKEQQIVRKFLKTMITSLNRKRRFQAAKNQQIYVVTCPQNGEILQDSKVLEKNKQPISINVEDGGMFEVYSDSQSTAAGGCLPLNPVFKTGVRNNASIRKIGRHQR